MIHREVNVINSYKHIVITIKICHTSSDLLQCFYAKLLRDEKLTLIEENYKIIRQRSSDLNKNMR